MALARIFALHLPFYDAKFTSKVEYQQPLGSLKTGRRLARNVRTALFGRDKLHFAALDFQAADIAREQVAGYIAFGAA